LGWKSPDAIVTPCGFGSVYLGLYIGFKELLDNGIIEKMPKLLGVQSDLCAPLYEATREKKKDNDYKVSAFTMKESTLAEVSFCVSSSVIETTKSVVIFLAHCRALQR
jgi:threonine synthase